MAEHGVLVEAKTCSPPPNRWYLCRCGWKPEPDENRQPQHGDASRDAVRAHIAERVAAGEVEVRTPPLVGPPK